MDARDPNGISSSVFQRRDWQNRVADSIWLKIARVSSAGITMFAFQRKSHWTHAIAHFYTDDAIILRAV